MKLSHLSETLIGSEIVKLGGEIREKIHGIVVGIENEHGRLVNPDSSYIIRPGDIVWVVGVRKSIDQFLHNE